MIRERIFDELSFVITNDDDAAIEREACARFKRLLDALSHVFKRNVEASFIHAHTFDRDAHNNIKLAYVTLAYTSDDDVMQLAQTYRALRNDVVRSLL